MTASEGKVRLRIESVAHGGHFVAKQDGAVYFVRHALPGELVDAQVTRTTQGGRVNFADAVEVIEPSDMRVAPACPAAGRCGGCDFQHVELEFQRELKTEVLREALKRMGKLDSSHPALAGAVEPLPGETDGLRWRTRVDLHTSSAGKVGFHAHGSSDVVQVSDCPVAVSDLMGDGVVNRPWGAGLRLRAVLPSASPKEVCLHEGAAPEIVERVGEWQYRLPATAFWQAHRAAPAAFVETALSLLKPGAGEHFLDLFAGVGLFTLPLAEAVGAGGRVDAVEGEREAVRYLRRNCKSVPQVQPHGEEVGSWLRSRSLRRVDAVLLDPPRSGAGRAVCSELARLAPSRLLYVACDPVALARDTATLGELGYELVTLRAFDAFPMTQHFETLALFEPK